ncbi:MAG: hypothetical protein H8E98_02050 [Bacteroidetes bacterium]|nr:hypothetical protein [Bacteroidota bacterium]MBL7003411.1 hypothetical protein [Gammaproteobacteria bacterium]
MKIDSKIQVNQTSTKNLRQTVFIVYILQALFFVTVITPIVGSVLNIMKKDELINSPYNSHREWQQNTFWFGLLWAALGTMTTFFLIGYVVLFFLTIWYVYRIVKGWIRLSDGKEMYDE